MSGSECRGWTKYTTKMLATPLDPVTNFYSFTLALIQVPIQQTTKQLNNCKWIKYSILEFNFFSFFVYAHKTDIQPLSEIELMYLFDFTLWILYANYNRVFWHKFQCNVFTFSVGDRPQFEFYSQITEFNRTKFISCCYCCSCFLSR